LLAVAKEKLDLETRPIKLHQLASVQPQVGRRQNDVTRPGRVFPINEDDHPQFPLERPVPDDGRVEMEMRFVCQRPEVLKPAQVLPVDLAVVLALAPAPPRMRFGVKEQTVGITTQFGDRVQSETDDFVNVFLLREVAVYGMISDLRWQPMAMLA